MAPTALTDTARTRLVLRVLGGVLLLAGVAAFGWGVYTVFTYEGFDGPPGLAVLAFIGAQSRYVAGETMPTLKQSAAYLSDGEGIMGVGRTVDDRQRGTAADGPYCRSCGVRNDEDARFCDGCGSSLA